MSKESLFPAALKEIQERIVNLDPIEYARTRNYKNGGITRLGPYISRGVISTKQVFEHILTLNLSWEEIEKIVQELAWRDYWQQIWIVKQDAIKTDLKNVQSPISNHEVPKAILKANTGIDEVDNALNTLYETGYMHNHMRMYVASICCNIANSHWLAPAQWMYSHLLDGDSASNFMSWQWVAGSFANKKYFANQGNINKFFDGDQRNTFLDIEYNEFENIETPEILQETLPFDYKTELPEVENQQLNRTKKSLIYNYYNLSPYWLENEKVQRILLLEPSFFKKYPITKKCMDFMLDLSKNIPEIIIFVGEFSDLEKEVDFIFFKEHPTNSHYKGTEMPREWMSNVKGYFPSFFAFWKKCKKEIRI